MQRPEFRFFFILVFPMVLVLPLPLNYSAITLALALLNLLILFFDKTKNKIKNWGDIFFNPLFILGTLVLLLDFITGSLRNSTLEFTLREARISFFVIPFIFSFTHEILSKVKYLLVKSFVIGVLIYIITCYAYLINFYSNLTNREFSLNHYLKYDLTTNVPNTYHHTYVGMYFSFSIMALFYFAYYKKLSNKIVWFLVLFIFLNQAFMGSKITMVWSLLVIVFVLVLKLSKEITKKTTKILASLLTCIGLSCGAIVFLKNQGLLITLENSISYRFEAWECSINLIKEKLLLGRNRETALSELQNCISSAMSGTHNQFLEELLYYGMFGFWILFFFYFLWVRKGIGFLSKSLILLLLTLSFFENIFTLQRGILFAVFFLSLFYYCRSSKQNKPKFG